MPTSRWERVTGAYEEGDLDTARREVIDALQVTPEDARLWELLGLIQYARHRFTPAVSALERASLIAPLTPAARVGLALAYGQVGRRELARDLLEQLIDDATLAIPLLLQVAAGLDAVGHPELAMQACRTASVRDPLLSQPYYDLGFYSARCGLPARVSEALARKAIGLAPENVSYRVGLASMLARLGRNSDAWTVVAKLSDEQLAVVTCRCCLERIADLYETHQDYRRSIVCREQLLRMELKTPADDCAA